MTRDEPSRDPTGDHLYNPPKKLVREIEDIEHTLRAGYMPINRYEKHRPMTAQLMRPRISPRATFAASGASPRYVSDSPRRPLSSVGAYRKAGLDPNNWPLQPSTTRRIEQWRSLPKYEEQMMLGQLRAMAGAGQLAPPPSWKLKRFQNVQPRLWNHEPADVGQ